MNKKISLAGLLLTCLLDRVAMAGVTGVSWDACGLFSLPGSSPLGPLVGVAYAVPPRPTAANISIIWYHLCY